MANPAKKYAPGKHPNSRKNSPFIKGHKVNEGRKLTPEWKEKVRLSKQDEKNPMWKGDEAGIHTLHRWVERRRGKPKKCEHCGTTKAKMYDWANVSREYKRLLDDWIRLCRRCHIIYDKK